MKTPVQLITFYLPQFHPIPENDTWWGKGFTEWTNVTKAQSLFPGHYQPHLPADLGFYDLRVPEVRQAQADLAQKYGIYGFCYYHYWFHGKPLLERPFHEVLMSGQPDFPFCLCWANENWTRRWDGQEQEILIQQTYSQKDDKQHFDWLLQAFHDKRYIHIDGKPLFIIYRADQLPDPLTTTSLWRKNAQRSGLNGLFLCKVDSFYDRSEPTSIGFDAAIEFQPDMKNLGVSLKKGRYWDTLRALNLSPKAYGEQYVLDYKNIVARMLQKPKPPYPYFPSVFPAWDNSPRRQRKAYILTGSTPELYELWLQKTIEKYKNPDSATYVFINAWNEWAEGAHLEPCQKWGRAYLEATKRAISITQK